MIEVSTKQAKRNIEQRILSRGTEGEVTSIMKLVEEAYQDPMSVLTTQNYAKLQRTAKKQINLLRLRGPA